MRLCSVVCVLPMLVFPLFGAPQSGELKTALESDCDYSGCSLSNYAAIGALNVDSDEVASTFGVKIEKYWNHFGTGVEAGAHLVHASSESHWGELEANIGKVGLAVYAGLEGIGLKLTAILYETFGKIGKGPLSFGLKLGLSADTGIRIGPRNEIKILGTGFTFGHDDGFEACVIGNCVSIG